MWIKRYTATEYWLHWVPCQTHLQNTRLLATFRVLLFQGRNIDVHFKQRGVCVLWLGIVCMMCPGCCMVWMNRWFGSASLLTVQFVSTCCVCPCASWVGLWYVWETSLKDPFLSPDTASGAPCTLILTLPSAPWLSSRAHKLVWPKLAQIWSTITWLWIPSAVCVVRFGFTLEFTMSEGKQQCRNQIHHKKQTWWFGCWH